MKGTVVIPDDYPGYSVDSFCISKKYKNDLDHVLIPQGLVRDRTRRLAEQIVQDMGHEPFTALCILKGAYRFFYEVLEEMKNYESDVIEVEFMRLKSYINTASTGKVVAGKDLDPTNLKGRNVLVVEDIVDTGRTMMKLFDVLNRPEYKPKSIKVVTLLRKRATGAVDYEPDYTGFNIPDRFVVGCAFDFNEIFRDLNHICVLSPDAVKRYSVTNGYSSDR
jgi:hypoxanthine phosphoribosyltransferase